MRRAGILAAWMLLVGGLATPASAQKEEDKRTGPYLGIAPGARDHAPGKKKVKPRGDKRIVTWVGFQMLGAGGRVFIQTTSPPIYTLVPGKPEQVVIELPDSRLHSKNDGRVLDATWFPTAIASIDADQLRGNVVRVTITLREVVGYDLRQEGNYLFLDFRPPTQPIPTPTLPGQAAPAAEPVEGGPPPDGR